MTSDNLSGTIKQSEITHSKLESHIVNLSFKKNYSQFVHSKYLEYL